MQIACDVVCIYVLKQVQLKRMQDCKNPEAVVWRHSVKMVFLKNLQNSQENTYARVSFFIKLQASYAEV